jgi:acetoin utilization deacetylase AcuC-like enzyme
MSTVFVFAPGAGHTKPGHPESIDRAAAVHQHLEQAGVLAHMLALPPVAATTKQLTRAHSLSLVEGVRQVSLRGGGMVDADTYTTSATFDAARLAAGGCCTAVDAIMSGEATNGLAVVRPPGHHAERSHVGGFCLFNNVAVAARQAQAVHGVGRVMIVDFDVHHGNGTQEIFYEDPSVLFFSTHLYHPFFYPGTGSMQQIGAGPGQGTTVNVPLPAGVGDSGYDRVFGELIDPKGASFRPELILVSAGFDAHWADPLAMAGLSLTGYAAIVRRLLAMAAEWCQGRILFVLEGGYYLEALAGGVLNLAYALLGRNEVDDPLGPAPNGETDVTDLLAALRRLHLPN